MHPTIFIDGAYNIRLRCF